MNAAKDFPDGITQYTQFNLTIPVFFPAGHEDCRYCRFCRHNDAFNTYRCSITESYLFDVLKGGRGYDCPLIMNEEQE